jgi:hypothetical protein
MAMFKHHMGGKKRNDKVLYLRVSLAVNSALMVQQSG